MDKPQTPPPGTPIIELTEVAEPEEQASQPARRFAPDKDLGELDRILAELNTQTPPPAQDDDLDKLMAEMGLPPQPREQAPSQEESEFQELLQELGGRERLEGGGPGEAGGTGDPELDDLLAQLGRQGAALERADDSGAAPEKAAVSGEASPTAEPEELGELVRLTVRQILEEDAPKLVSRLVAQELKGHLKAMVAQELGIQLKSMVAQEVKDILKKAMTMAGKASEKRDDGVVVD